MQSKKMNCFECGEELIWYCDDTNEERGIEGDGLVRSLTCNTSDCSVKVVQIYIEEKYKILLK